MHLIRATAIAAAALLTAAAAHAQDGSKYPDWSGQWRRPANVAPAWDPTKPPGLGQQAPLTPEYQAIFEATLKDRAGGGLTGDPTVPAARAAADDGGDLSGRVRHHA